MTAIGAVPRQRALQITIIRRHIDSIPQALFVASRIASNDTSGICTDYAPGWMQFSMPSGMDGVANSRNAGSTSIKRIPALADMTSANCLTSSLEASRRLPWATINKVRLFFGILFPVLMVGILISVIFEPCV
jgi:hypothetical protein